MTEDDPRETAKSGGRRHGARARCRTGCIGSEIERQRQVTAHAPSGPGRNFIRVLVGDRVRLELSPRDLTRGRIVEVIGSRSESSRD